MKQLTTEIKYQTK